MNIERRLKNVLGKLLDLKDDKLGLHIALATSDYSKIDDIPTEEFVNLLENYTQLLDFDPIKGDFQEYEEEEFYGS